MLRYAKHSEAARLHCEEVSPGNRLQRPAIKAAGGHYADTLEVLNIARDQGIILGVISNHIGFWFHEVPAVEAAILLILGGSAFILFISIGETMNSHANLQECAKPCGLSTLVTPELLIVSSEALWML